MKIGQTVEFVDRRGIARVGEIVYINLAHRWLSVKYQSRNLIGGRVCDLFETLHTLPDGRIMKG